MERRARVPHRAKVDACRAGVRRLPLDAECHQHPAVGGELVNHVTEVVRAIDGIVGADRDPVRAGEEAVAP